ncbi:MAG: FAD-dependent oxidoreductase [Candidatus Omnitrophica bacterium]|nr:FAD-dependent oxidoreductase [Candidatus Omnitrophota bacterium]
MDTNILKVIQRTHNVKSFRCEPKARVDFTAGQFMKVTLKVNQENQSKYFSISNSPTEKGYYEFTKKITESDFSKALDRLKAGDPLTLDLPKGSFTLKEEDKKAAFLSGGIGITPLRSMIQYAVDMNLKVNIVLLYGNHTEKDIVFREDLDALSDHSQNVRIIHTLDSPDIDRNRWRGRTGLINAQMIKEEVPDYQERKFFICGPPQMVLALNKTLKDDLEIQADRIKTEKFSGY